MKTSFRIKSLKKKQNQNKFEIEYQTKPQTAVAGTKHTITTDTNKIIHRKLVSKPLPNSFQNLLSRRGKTRGERTDGSFRCPYPHSIQRKTKKGNPSQKKITEEKVRPRKKRRPNNWTEVLTTPHRHR